MERSFCVCATRGAKRAIEAVAAMCFGLVFICMASLARINAVDRDPWSVGDWLINYQGGFVRRGLPRELAYHVQHWLHRSSAVALVVWFQLLVYAVLLRATWLLLKRSSWSFPIKAFIASPATLSFPIIDSLGGFRKDVLLLAGLAVLIVLLRNRHASQEAICLYMAAMTVVLTLSHEGMLLYLPYWFAAVGKVYRNLRQTLLLVLPCALLGAACWYAAVTHPGTPALAQQVCTSVGGEASGLCDGAIMALAQSRDDAHHQVVVLLAMYHPVLRYTGLSLLAFLPALIAFPVLWRVPALRCQLRYAAAGSLLSLALTTMLFVYAVDWSRWIYLHAFSLFLLLLCVDRGREAPAEESRTQGSAWVMLSLLAYMTLWRLPRIAGPLPEMKPHAGAHLSRTVP